MRVAFHFDEDVAFKKGLLVPAQGIAKAICAAIPPYRRHVVINGGSLSPQRAMPKSTSLGEFVDELLGIHVAAWTSLTYGEIVEMFSKKQVAAYVLRGLTPKAARDIHGTLSMMFSKQAYLGAIEIIPENEVSWAAYQWRLPARYRIIGDELRIFYYQFELEVEDNRDHVGFRQWQDSAFFAKVTWEDLGVRDTVFDPYIGLDYARVSGEAEDLVNAQFARVVNEIFLRVAQLDPRLVLAFHGALKAFDKLDTGDSLAHVAISCRRLIEQLANALDPLQGTGVGKEAPKYRNRLKKYVQDNLAARSQRQLIIQTLDDIGGRIDRLDQVANKGLHAKVEVGDTQRLLIGLTCLIYDLLTLAPPPLITPDSPYNENVVRMAREFLKHDDA